jgi:hypothetical protein
VLNCNTYDVGLHAAVELGADKLFCLHLDDVMKVCVGGGWRNGAGPGGLEPHRGAGMVFTSGSSFGAAAPLAGPAALPGGPGPPLPPPLCLLSLAPLQLGLPQWLPISSAREMLLNRMTGHVAINVSGARAGLAALQV